MQKINSFGKTDTGKLRENNEDNLIFQPIWDEKHLLGVVIDGVGGYAGGEAAAETAKKTIVEFLEKYPNGERLMLLKEAVTEANNQIYQERRNQPQYSNMSCVLTACLVEVEKKQFNMVHIGDTRLYRFCKGSLKKLSHDHSYVGAREDMGGLTEAEAMSHPRRNEINRLLGENLHQADDKDFIQAETFPLLPGSILLLCSDGLTDLVTRAEISGVLSQEIPLEQKVQALIDLANDKGGKDNITVVLIDYETDELPESIENIEIVDVSTALNEQPVEHPVVEHNPIVNRKSKIDLQSRRKNPKIWIISALLLGLLIGAGGGWLARKHCEKTENRELRNAIRELQYRCEMFIPTFPTELEYVEENESE